MTSSAAVRSTGEPKVEQQAGREQQRCGEAEVRGSRRLAAPPIHSTKCAVSREARPQRPQAHMSSVSTPAVPHSIPSISSSRDLQQPCGDWRLNTSSRTLGADTLAPAYQDCDTPRKETFSSRDDLGVAGGSLAGCERAGHSSREVQILTVGRTGAERRQACAARWGRLRRSRIGALEARSPRMDGRVVREPRRVVNPEKKKNRSPPSGHQRWLV